MFEEARSALETLDRFVGELEAERLTTEQAAELTGLFAQFERAAVCGKLLVAARAAKGVAWAEAGHRSPASWLAELAGSGFGEAIRTLETAERLRGLPDTAEALRQGRLSGPQAHEVAAAATVNPGAETELLEAAEADSFKQLKERARRAKTQAASQVSEAQREAAIYNSRYLRHWCDEDGALRLDARLTPLDGAQVLATLEARARHQFEEARQAGTYESEAAYLADALVALCSEGTGSGSGAGRPPAKVHLRADLAALRRGSLEAGELCEIPGVGPVPLATARDILGDSFLTLFVTDGIDIHSLVHYGRTVRAPIRRALEERDPCCVVPRCGATRFLEIDHWQVDFADDGPTELWNLCRLCPHHHRLKTRGDFELFGGPGKWEFRPLRGANRPPPAASRPPPAASRPPPADVTR